MQIREHTLHNFSAGFQLDWFKLCSIAYYIQTGGQQYDNNCPYKVSSEWSLPQWHTASVTRQISPNVYKSCTKIISLDKWMSLTSLQKLPNNVGILGKIIVATGFEWLPKVQKIVQSGHAGHTSLYLGTNWRPPCLKNWKRCQRSLLTSASIHLRPRSETIFQHRRQTNGPAYFVQRPHTASRSAEPKRLTRPFTIWFAFVHHFELD